MVFRPDEVPEQFLQAPRDLPGRVVFYEFWLERAKHEAVAGSDRAEREFWAKVQTKHVRAMQRQLDGALEALYMAHECACCGILLTKTNDSVGPECAKHPNEFPCNHHRGK